ncbi:hypothetical protein [Georgenia sp. H159]|uniref:hypothetical protein n=1 Tax=Georgenia sp. H159 TaxID=3076115 RepID=UPI002D77BA7D|nr:hypothetical protein [Georgenia sp. H159]
MPVTELTTRQKALVAGLCLLAVAALVSVGLLLREHAPGNMGNGFLAGGGIALVGFAVMAWRTARRPEQTTTFERGWTQSGDERDDAVLTRSLAVLGLLALPLTGVAGIAVALGVDTSAALAVLLLAEIGALAVAFAVINRRS